MQLRNYSICILLFVVIVHQPSYAATDVNTVQLQSNQSEPETSLPLDLQTAPQEEISRQLIDAAYLGNLELLESLWRSGRADINAPVQYDTSVVTPLMASMLDKQGGPARKWLLDRGADPKIESVFSDFTGNPIDWAAGASGGLMMDSLALFEPHVAIGLNAERVPTHLLLRAVFYACKDHAELANELIAGGAKIGDSISRKNYVPILVEAARWMSPTATACLLNLGADPNAVNSDGESALSATMNSKIQRSTTNPSRLKKIRENVELLINAGAAFNQVFGEYKQTPLYHALRLRPTEDSEAIIGLLLSKGADANMPSNGLTPLTQAVSAKWGSNTKFSKFTLMLMDSGARARAGDLVAYISNLKKLDEDAEEVIRRMLRSGLDIDETDDRGHSVLDVISSSRSEEDKIYKYLYEKGARYSKYGVEK